MTPRKVRIFYPADPVGVVPGGISETMTPSAAMRACSFAFSGG